MKIKDTKIVYVSPDNNVHDTPPCGGIDYEMRRQGRCLTCLTNLVPQRGKDSAVCLCGESGWFDRWVEPFISPAKSSQQPMGPIKDYVDVSPVKKTSRIDTLMSVLAAPVISAAIFSMSTSVVEWHVAAVYGFSIGYVLQAVLVFTWNTIKSIIKGDSRGI